MRRTIGLMCVMMFAAMVAQANVYVSWSMAAGLYWGATPPGFDASRGFLGDGTGSSALAQLIWSENDSADLATVANANYVSGDDHWLADFSIIENGESGDLDSFGSFSAPDFNDGGSLPLGGYLYVRVFENATPQVNDWYYVGPAVPALNKDLEKQPPDGAQFVEANTDPTSDPYFNQLDGARGAQVVPEPGTFALFGLGAAVVALRRRRR